jgi:WD40 repeat protein
MSPDGRRAVTGGRDGAAVLWDLAARQPIGTLAHDRGNFVNLAAFSPDMQRLVTATRGRVWFWNPVTGAGDGEPISALSDYEDLTDLAFADAGRALVAAGSDGSVVLWDVRSRTRLGPALSGRRESVGAVAVEPGGTRIAIGLRNGRVLLWDYASAARPLEFPDGHGDRVEAVAFAPDGKRVATGGSDGRVVLWDAVTLKRLGAEKAAGGALHTLVFSPDGRRLAAAGADGKLTLWDSDAGFRGGVWLPAHSRPVRKLAFSPDGRRVITASDDTTAVLWEVVERDKFSRIVRRYEGSVRRLSFVHGGRFLAVGRLRALNIVDLATGAPVTEIKGENGGEIDTAALSADGRRAALVDEGQVSLWESPGRRDRVPAPAGGKPARLALSPDGRRLAIGRDDGGISVWDWEARRFLSQAAGAHKRITALAFSPDASRLASGGIEGAINLWTVGAPEQKPRRVGSARGAVADLAFSPDGTRLAAGGDEEEIVVWDLRAAEPVATRITDYAGITRSMLGITRAIAFSPDGRMVVSAGTGQAIAIWDADTGRPIGRPLEGHEKPILAMAFSPDGKLLASGGQDATLRIWNLDIAWWVHRACRLIDPGISRDAWRKRVPGAPYPESCRSDKSSPEGRALPAQALIPASRSTSAAASRR